MAPRWLARTVRLWGVVLVGNLIGAAVFALLAMRTPALPAAVRDELVTLGLDTAAPSFTTVFWSAIFAGWLIALVAWLVTASTTRPRRSSAS
jgi:formate-nitrite transporter family protein